MNKDIVNQVKDRIYEAEGLLELLHLRPEKHPELAPLILNRIDEARALFANAMPDEPEAVVPAEVSEEVDELHEPGLDEDQDPADEDEETAGGEPEADDAGGCECEPEPAEEPEPEPVVTVRERREEHVAERSTPAFCLNDRYRFRRTIFGGSDAEFNSTMDHVATLDGIEEAEDFFYGDMGLDAEDPDVADFMDIIRNYFAR